MESKNLERLVITRKTGSERFHANGKPLEFSLLGFWQWSSSNLVSNAMRGVLAEYIVACDLGVADGLRTEWEAYDLHTQRGVKVEVKSAAFLQSWKQAKLSSICFGIRQSYGWDAITNEMGAERKRQAHVYVFALLKHQDKATLDPLDVVQWDFYILPTAVLNTRLASQKQISIATLLKLHPVRVKFGHISSTIEVMFPNRGKRS